MSANAGSGGMAETSEAVRHGGDLGEARRLFPGAAQPWIDLSTGINPVPYPHLGLEASDFARLPAAADLAALKDAAARAYGADPAGIVAAPGTQILIETLPRLRPPSRVAVVGPTYGEHAPAWRRAGHAVADVAGLDEAAAAADVAVITDPNNPDGRVTPRAVLADAAARLAARGGWLLVDEAFADLEPVASLAAAAPPRACPEGAIVLRSFGKAYGLAGLRLGFAVTAPALAGRLAAALGPWAVSGPALAIGRRALADEGWRTAAATARARDAARLDALVAAAGGTVLGGTRLFRLARFADGPARFARLGGRGIWVRRFAEAPDHLRFGLPADGAGWDRLAAALPA